ncbi:MAG: hypothetical protein V4623_00440 [Pseudomonadota bacterium]
MIVTSLCPPARALRGFAPSHATDEQTRASTNTGDGTHYAAEQRTTRTPESAAA